MRSLSQSPPTLWADFNEYDNRKERIGTTLRLCQPMLIPEVGDVVILKDCDGMSCWATVRRVRGDWVDCQVIPDTWRDPARFTLTSASPPGCTVTV